MFSCTIVIDLRLEIITMNNKKGGFGARLVLVLILMIASAIGGAYGYRVLDGKMAVSDAKKEIDAVRVSEYDTEEAAVVQGYIDDAKSKLETATTRKQVYEIVTDFDSDVDKVLTRTEKELEEARKAISNSNSNNNSGNTTDNSITSGGSTDSGTTDNSSGGILSNLFGNGNDSSTDDTDSGNSTDIFNNNDN